MGDRDCFLVSSVVIKMSWRETEAMVVQPTHIPYVTELTLKQSMDLEDAPVSKVKPCKIEDLSSIPRTLCFKNK